MRHFKGPNGEQYALSPEDIAAGGLGYIPKDSVEITEQEAQALREANAPKPTAEQVRALRNLKLAESEWTQAPDTELTVEQVEEWRAYRKALRRVPQQEGFPETVNWPVKPQ